MDKRKMNLSKEQVENAIKLNKHHTQIICKILIRSSFNKISCFYDLIIVFYALDEDRRNHEDYTCNGDDDDDD